MCAVIIPNGKTQMTISINILYFPHTDHHVNDLRISALLSLLLDFKYMASLVRGKTEGGQPTDGILQLGLVKLYRLNFINAAHG
jgi:hypothetical protein